MARFLLQQFLMPTFNCGLVKICFVMLWWWINIEISSFIQRWLISYSGNMSKRDQSGTSLLHSTQALRVIWEQHLDSHCQFLLGASQVALVVKTLPANAGDIRDTGSTPGSGSSPGERHGNPLQYSCLENPMDRGAWWVTVQRVAKSWTLLKWLSTHNSDWSTSAAIGSSRRIHISALAQKW